MISTDEPTTAVPRLRDLAYYYPDTYWLRGQQSDWVKSVLLFFDGVATLVPEHARSKAIHADPTLVEPLLSTGSMVMLEPTEIIDLEAVELMGEALTEWLRADRRRTGEWPGEWRSMSYSRLGSDAHPELFQQIFSELVKQGLAAPGDRLNMSIRGDIREAVLTLWSQILREPGRKLGFDLSPITRRHRYPLAENLSKMLTDVKPISAGTVVELDLQAVGINLARVPLDEIEDFRAQYGSHYRAYRRDLNRLVGELSLSPRHVVDQLLRDRQEELREEAQRLQKRLTKSFTIKNIGSFGLGALGAAWGIKSGNYPTAALAATGALWALTKDTAQPGSLLYLFDVDRQWSGR